MPQGKNAISRWILDGQTINAPKEWQTAEALATFDNESVQASISIDKFTFVNAEATRLLQHIQNGMTGGVGIMEGIPFTVELHNQTNLKTIFNGMIGLSDGVEINEFSNQVITKLKLRDELFSLEEKVQSLSFGYLESLGMFSNSSYTEIKYVVEKKNNVIEIIVSAIALYMMTKELIEVIYKLIEQVGHFVSLVAAVPGGALGATVWAFVAIILNILYAALILLAILKLGSTLIDQLIPIKRTAKALKFRTAFQQICIHLGYTFQSNISDLDSVHYLPSNFSFDSTTQLGIIDNFVGNKKGIPSSSDYGYNCAEFFELAKKLFNGKYAIIDGKVCFYNVDDPFWNQYSTYQMPSVREKIKTYNTDELKANIYLTFDVDFSDEWTINNYTGTAYEVITKPQIINDTKLNRIVGLDEIRFGACLGNRKSEPYGLENFLHTLASKLDSITNTFGGSSNYESQIGDSVGLMKISTNNWSKPKVLKITTSKRLVPREQWSAKYIYNTYYLGKSFMATVNGMPNYGQKEVYRNIKIPFGLDDFVLLCQNSYFNLPDGTKGKVISCKYRFSADTAIVDYYIRKPYTTNLTQIYVEPSNQ